MNTADGLAHLDRLAVAGVIDAPRPRRRRYGRNLLGWLGVVLMALAVVAWAAVAFGEEFKATGAPVTMMQQESTITFGSTATTQKVTCLSPLGNGYIAWPARKEGDGWMCYTADAPK